MKYYELDQEEKKILEDYEAGIYKPVPDLKEEIRRHAKIARRTLEKTKNVNIRLTYKDIHTVRSKAVERGIPYQTILSTLIHQYATGKIKLEL